MNGCEYWTIKKAEHWRTDAFELWCWRRLLGVIWTARRSNQSILKEINPEFSLEEWMLKLQNSGQLMRRANSLEKTHAGKDRRWEEKGTTGDEMVGWHCWLNGHELEKAPGDCEGQGTLEYCSSCGKQELDMTEQLNNNIWNNFVCSDDEAMGEGHLISVHTRDATAQWSGT